MFIKFKKNLKEMTEAQDVEQSLEYWVTGNVKKYFETKAKDGL